MTPQRSPQIPTAGELQLIAPGVLMTKSAAAKAVLACIDFAISAHRRGDITAPPYIDIIRAAYAQCAHPDADCGPADPRRSPRSRTWAGDEITTGEVATMLSITREHANRLARAGTFGPSRVVKGRRLASRAAVQAHRATRDLA